MGLIPKPKGKKAMSNSNTTNNTNKTKATNKAKSTWKTKQDHEKSVDDLLDELAHLKAENDYLKKARCLNSSKGTISTNKEQVLMIQELRHQHKLTH